MTLRDWLAMPFLIAAVYLQAIGISIAGPRGREMLVNADGEAIKKVLNDE